MPGDIDDPQRPTIPLGSTRRLRSPFAPSTTSNDSRLKAYSTTWRRTSSLSNPQVSDSVPQQTMRRPALPYNEFENLLNKCEMTLRETSTTPSVPNPARLNVATNFQFVEPPSVRQRPPTNHATPSVPQSRSAQRGDFDRQPVPSTTSNDSRPRRGDELPVCRIPQCETPSPPNHPRPSVNHATSLQPC